MASGVEMMQHSDNVTTAAESHWASLLGGYRIGTPKWLKTMVVPTEGGLYLSGIHESKDEEETVASGVEMMQHSDSVTTAVESHWAGCFVETFEDFDDSNFMD